MKKAIVFIFVLILTLNVQEALAIGGNFNEYAQEAHAGLASLPQKIKQFNINTLHGYSPDPNPPASKYAGNNQQMVNDARAQFLTSKDSQAIQTSFFRPQYKINSKSPSISKSLFVQSDAYDISHGISDKYVKCTANPQQCTTKYKTQTCKTANHRVYVCTQTVNVTVTQAHVKGCVHLVSPQSGRTVIGPDSHGYCDMGLMHMGIPNHTFNWITHRETISLPPGKHGRLVLGMQQGDSYSTIYGKASLTHGPTVQRQSGSQGYVTSSAPATTASSNTITLSGKYPTFSGNSAYVLAYITVPYNYYVVTKKLQIGSNCTGMGHMVAAGYCSAGAQKCVVPGGTREINGLNVYESCWGYQTHYNCGSTEDTCSGFLSQGCSQIGANCIDQKQGICLLYQDTLQCPIKVCKPSDGIICGGNYFCINGGCYTPKTSKSANFGKDDGEFAAAVGAGESLDKHKHSVTIFPGDGANCSLAPLGFLNCCADHGWGKHIGLAKCSAEEKKLGKDKENGLAIYVGEYCAHKLAGLCTEHRKGYCVFSTLIGVDIQQQGRQGQLGIGFGSGQNPDCSGLTPKQLQKIDFSKIDFSNVAAAIKAKWPNSGAVAKRIAQKIKKQWGNQ